MRTAWVLVFLAIASSAHANPISVTLGEMDARVALGKLVERNEEPIGLAATANIPALALQQGDLVRAINGASPASMKFALSPSTIYYLDVVRGTKRLTVRVAIKLDPREHRMERAWFTDRLDRIRKHGPDLAMRQATKQGQPSGVIIGTLFGVGDLGDGDIIRKIDGKVVKTVDEVVAVLERAATNPKIVIDAERVGEPFTFTLLLEDPPKGDPDIDAAIAKIKKINDTTYEIPRDLVDRILVNPMAIAKGARIVPAMKNGKPDGLKLYAIRPTSLYAKLGLENGDTVSKINGEDISSVDRVLEVYSKLRAAKSFKIEITRRGKPLTLEWKLGK